MGSITFAVEGKTSISETFNLSDEDADRLIAMAVAWYGANSPEAGLSAWAQDMLGIIRERVMTIEREAAARAAVKPFTAEKADEAMKAKGL